MRKSRFLATVLCLIAAPSFAQIPSPFVQVTWLGSSVIVSAPEDIGTCLRNLFGWHEGDWVFTAHRAEYSAVGLKNGDMSACVVDHGGMQINRKPSFQELFDGAWSP